MKRTLGLVMALVMILTAVSAFAAEVPSITVADLVKVTTVSKNVTVTVTENETEPVVELLATLLTDNSIPAEAKEALPEGSTYTKVEEVTTLKIEGGTAEEDLVINLSFTTNYAKKNVAILIGVLENGKIVWLKSVETIGKEDGSIDLELSGELQDLLNGREFIAMIAE